MRVALAAKRCVVGDVDRNVRTVVEEVREYADWGVDLVCFPEAFLQGFPAFTGDPDHDRAIALSVDSPAIEKIRRVARQTRTAVCVGFYERDGGTPATVDEPDPTCAHRRHAREVLGGATPDYGAASPGVLRAPDDAALYSSALVVGRDGTTLGLYRRMSTGWRGPDWDEEVYRTGVAPVTFELADKRCTVALCGDLFALPERFKAVEPQVVLWPLHRDLDVDGWNGGELEAYARQANQVYASVLMVNPVQGGAVGGAAWFRNGKVKAALDIDGAPGTLVVDIR